MYAAGKALDGAARILIARGADRFLKNNKGQTALHLATQNDSDVSDTSALSRRYKDIVAMLRSPSR